MSGLLRVKFSEDRNGRPLAVVENFPGLNAEMTPKQLRAMADALHMVADECECGPAFRRFGMGKGNATYDY